MMIHVAHGMLKLGYSSLTLVVNQMRDLNSVDYYRFREEKERELSAVALNPEISAIHLDMAERYAAIIQQSALSSTPNHGEP